MIRRVRYSRFLKADRKLLDAVEREKMLAKSRQRSVNGKSIRVPPSDRLIEVAGNKWKFASESALEDFVWENLTAIFGLTPLERQRSINGERCDIISVSPERQLVILELKNAQDRGVVQQLTRYYANAIDTRPFDVDYQQPVRLIAVTPNFHKHNFIDREYSQLIFEFLEFEIDVKDDDLYLLLKNVDTKNVWSIQIAHKPEQVHDIKEHLPPIPNVLAKMIEPCSTEQREVILQVRETLLCFHERLQEIKGANFVKYGRGETKICAEIRCNNNIEDLRKMGFHQPILFLYLPIPDRSPLHSQSKNELNKSAKHPVGRMRILSSDTNINWKSFPDFGFAVASYIPSGRRTSVNSYGMKAFTPFLTSQGNSDLDKLVALALQSWLDRL